MNYPTIEQIENRTNNNNYGDTATLQTPNADERLRREIDEIVAAVPVTDLHTHLFAPQFEDLNLYGIDELLNYHYLIAELFRYSPVTPAEFWQMDKRAQADLIWRTLFVENTPLSEATRGVIYVMTALGLDARAETLHEARAFFAAQKPEEYLAKILKIANVSDIVMTNDPLDEAEIEVWNDAGRPIDRRFHAALRLDRLLNGWPEAAPLIAQQNYKVSADLDAACLGETRRFLDDWIEKMKPLYLGASLPDDFNYPEESVRGKLIKEVVLPAARAHKLPLALMIGVRRRVNPALKLAGDGVGCADVSALARICAENPDVRILSTFLARENQHELCVAARKFSNLMPFGCWWFLNNDSIIREITAMRFELLGTSFIPQHSDARVLEQLIYKWQHSRRAIADVMFDSYRALLADGRAVTRAEIERDAENLFSGNFRRWANMK